MLKPGKIRYEPPHDPVRESGGLVVEILDDAGKVIDHLAIAANAITDVDERRSIEIFAYNVVEEVRKVQYRKEHADNDEMIRYELREDFDDWYLRQRRGLPRHEGIDAMVLAEWSRHR